MFWLVQGLPGSVVGWPQLEGVSVAWAGLAGPIQPSASTGNTCRQLARYRGSSGHAGVPGALGPPGPSLAQSPPAPQLRLDAGECCGKDLRAAKLLFHNPVQVVILLSSRKNPNTSEVLGKIELITVFPWPFSKLRKMGKNSSSWVFLIPVSGFIYTMHQEVSHQHYLS